MFALTVLLLLFAVDTPAADPIAPLVVELSNRRVPVQFSPDDTSAIRRIWDIAKREREGPAIVAAVARDFQMSEDAARVFTEAMLRSYRAEFSYGQQFDRAAERVTVQKLLDEALKL